MKVGDLIKDFNDGQHGVILSNLQTGPFGEEYIMVKWFLLNEQVAMDAAALDNGWVEVVNENR